MMQRVVQIGRRYRKCISAFEDRTVVTDITEGRQYISLYVECEDFETLAEACTDALVKGYVTAYVDRAVYRPDSCFNSQERDMILADVMMQIAKEKIHSAVVRNLCKSSYVNLDGIFNFSLREFCEELDEICTLATDKYILKNEYLDFIRTLRFFASVNYGSVDVVHVVMNGNNKADLYDANHRAYRPSAGCDIEIAAEMLYEYDDIVSELVEASPLSVVIHRGNMYEDSELVETIVNIFDDRVSFCTGCRLCIEEK